VTFHRRYLTLVEDIERSFRVADWRADDLSIWPLARMDLYLDLYRAHVGITPVPPRALPVRMLERFAAPLVNLYRSRHDLSHWIGVARRADAILLGDGVSLDYLDGSWRDRYGEPVMAALERQGLSTFLMQTGDLSRLPWYRPTYAANVVAFRGTRRSLWLRTAIEAPDHERVLQYLQTHAVDAPSLRHAALTRRARRVLATATEFESILKAVQPRLAFVVTYYADLGPAFLLACRRRRILSVDLQHCPQEGAHKAYGWWSVPDDGYGVLPAVFWNWTQAEAAYISQWTSRLAQPWHRSIHGGHVQLAPYLDDHDPAICALDDKYDLISGKHAFEREILVTLQPVTGYRAQWDALAGQIEASPRNWRWWVRRHPASRPYQDREYQRLVRLELPNVVVDASSSLPLPALLRRMSVLVSRFSGASAEAANFGVPALFLSEEARGQFSSLIERGCARIVDISELNATIASLPARPVRPQLAATPELDRLLVELEGLARDYSQLYSLTAH
jgi:hypothetical protein